MLLRHSSLLASLLGWTVQVQAQWPNPEPCSGNCQVHDPSLIRRDDGTYFLFGSAPGISAKSAPSLNGPWTALADVFSTSDQLGVGTYISVQTPHLNSCRLLTSTTSRAHTISIINAPWWAPRSQTSASPHPQIWNLGRISASSTFPQKQLHATTTASMPICSR